MKEAIAADVSKQLDFSRLFLAKVIAIDTIFMQMEVEIVESITYVKQVNIPCAYISQVCNSGVVVVPRVGDFVLMAKRQEIWECVGYTMISYAQANKDSNTNSDVMQGNTTTWNLMQKIKDDGKLGIGAPPPQLSEGDVAIFLHEQKKAVDFCMLKNGLMIMSTGMATLVLNDTDVSMTEMLNYKKTFMANDGGGMEFGTPQMLTGPDGSTQLISTGFLWKVYSQGLFNESIELGYVNNGVTPVLTTSTGSPVRFRIKTKLAEVLIGLDGSVAISGLGPLDVNMKSISLNATGMLEGDSIENHFVSLNDMIHNSLTSNLIITRAQFWEIITQIIQITADALNIKGAAVIDGMFNVTGSTVLATLMDPKLLVNADAITPLVAHKHIYPHVHPVAGGLTGQPVNPMTLPSEDLTVLPECITKGTAAG